MNLISIFLMTSLWNIVQQVFTIIALIIIFGLLFFFKPLKHLLYAKVFYSILGQTSQQVIMFRFHPKNQRFYCTLVSDSFLNFYHFNKKDVLYKDLNTIFGANADAHQKFLKQVVENQSSAEQELWWNEKLIQYNYIHLKHDRNTVLIYCFDITNLRQEQQLLEVTKNRLSSALELAKNVGFLEVNRKKRTAWFSRYFFELFELNDWDSTKHLLEYQDIIRLVSTLQMVVNDHQTMNFDVFKQNRKNKVECVLPRSKQKRYFEVELIGQNGDHSYYAFIDITEKTHENITLKQKLKYDYLTGFMNREFLLDEIKHLIDQYKAYMGVLYSIDILELGKINQHYGHDFGDQVIKKIAEYLSKVCYESELDAEFLPARKAGDEFVIYVHSRNKNIGLQELKTLFSNTKINLIIDETPISVVLKVGMAIYNQDAEDVTTLLEYSDFALQTAKGDLLNDVHLFNSKKFAEVRRKKDLMRELTSIIKTRDWHHVYQPILDFNSVEYLGYEALARPHKASIQEILELAYEVGVFAALERALYVSTIEDFAKHFRKDKYVSINEGPFDIFENDLDEIAEVADYIQKEQLKIIIEITEYAQLDMAILQKKIERIKRYTKLAIDDFGSGFANEIALLALDPDYIKIDRGLIADIDTDERKQTLVSNIVNYAGDKCYVIAEGIETKAELMKVMELGVHGAQGYYICEPKLELVDITEQQKAEIIAIKEELNQKHKHNYT